MSILRPLTLHNITYSYYYCSIYSLPTHPPTQLDHDIYERPTTHTHTKRHTDNEARRKATQGGEGSKQATSKEAKAKEGRKEGRFWETRETEHRCCSFPFALLPLIPCIPLHRISSRTLQLGHIGKLCSCCSAVRHLGVVVAVAVLERSVTGYFEARW